MSIEIPDKTWFKIGEVARIVGVKPYVIRYWESEFRALRPAKTKSRQRLFRQRDIELLLLIRRLLHEEKFTVDGARKQLKEMSTAGLSPADVLEAELAGMDVGLTTVQRMALRDHGATEAVNDVDHEAPVPSTDHAVDSGRPGTLPLPLGGTNEEARPEHAGEGESPFASGDGPVGTGVDGERAVSQASEPEVDRLSDKRAEPAVSPQEPAVDRQRAVVSISGDGGHHEVAALSLERDSLRGEVAALQERLTALEQERDRLSARMRALVETSRRRWREVRRLVAASGDRT